MPATSDVPEPDYRFLLREPRARHESARTLLHDDELLERLQLTVAEPADRGRFLAELLSALPTADDRWVAAGALASTDNRAATLLIVSAVGSDRQTADAFFHTLEGAGSGKSIRTNLFADPQFRETCTIRSWNNPQHDPEAVAIVARHLLEDMPADRFAEVLRNRYRSIEQEMRLAAPHFKRRSDPIVEFDRTLRTMQALGVPVDRESIVARAREQLSGYVTAHDERQRQAELIETARNVVPRAEGNRSEDVIRQLLEATSLVAEFNRGRATLILLEGLNDVGADRDDKLTDKADEMLDEMIGPLKEIARGQPDQSVPRGLRDVLQRIIDRRVRTATTIEGERVVVDDDQLAEIDDDATVFRLEFDEESARQLIDERVIPRKQEVLDACNLIGVDIAELPPGVIAVSVQCGNARTYSESAGESDQVVVYDEMPTLTFTVAPAREDLDSWGSARLDQYPDERISSHIGLVEGRMTTLPHSVVRSRDVQIEVGLSRLADFAARALGIPTNDDAFFDEAVAERATRAATDDPMPGKMTFSVPTPTSEVEFGVDQGWHPRRTAFDPDGRMTVPQETQWALPLKADRREEPSLRVSTTNVSVRIETGDVSATEATRRALALALAVRNSPDVADRMSGWRYNSWSGNVTLVKKLNDVPTRVADDVRARIAAGVPIEFDEPTKRSVARRRAVPPLSESGPSGRSDTRAPSLMAAQGEAVEEPLEVAVSDAGDAAIDTSASQRDHHEASDGPDTAQDLGLI